MRINFGDWLSSKLVELDMKPADLTRVSGFDSGVLSNIINGKRQPSVETLKVIARSLNLPLEEVYRAAGILPPKPNNDAFTEAVLVLLNDLPNGEKKDILEYVRFRHKLSREQQHDSKHTKGNSTRSPAT